MEVMTVPVDKLRVVHPTSGMLVIVGWMTLFSSTVAAVVRLLAGRQTLLPGVPGKPQKRPEHSGCTRLGDGGASFVRSRPADITALLRAWTGCIAVCGRGRAALRFSREFFSWVGEAHPVAKRRYLSSEISRLRSHNPLFLPRCANFCAGVFG